MQLYNEDYYERGTELKISGYQNYRWLPEQTLLMCSSIVAWSNIDKKDSILDFGCAKGYVVKSLLSMGFNCEGADISKYAIENCDAEVADCLQLLSTDDKISKNYDVILAKDVLEHISYKDINCVISNFREKAKKVVIIVPLAENGKYVAPEYELDVTHVIREDMQWWINLLKSCGFSNVDARYKVEGVKDNWAHYERANAFFVCT